jgi:hypothetical protein
VDVIGVVTGSNFFPSSNSYSLSINDGTGDIDIVKGPDDGKDAATEASQFWQTKQDWTPVYVRVSAMERLELVKREWKTNSLSTAFLTRAYVSPSLSIGKLLEAKQSPFFDAATRQLSAFSITLVEDSNLVS